MVDIIEINSKKEFDLLIQKEVRPIILDFYATWCGPCKRIAPFFKKKSEQFPDIAFVKVDIDKNDNDYISQDYNISGMPTFVLIKDKKEIYRFSGASEVGIENMIKQFFKIEK